jgi:undecaprenyl phosphate N,N'-diacetylbacillosamine 1-phosphate transferase
VKESRKRITDICISLPLIVLLLPVFAIIAIAIKLTSKGPVIFRQERTSRNGAPFIFYKFRSMKSGVEPFAQSPQSEKDPRLTKVGRFLREYSLDELPQLFNILKGDMSVVGPRPLYLSQMAKWNERQRKRLLVKPGLTGLAQISGRGEVTHEEKLELDVKYVETASLWLDLKIILVTIGHVFARKSIYEKDACNTNLPKEKANNRSSPAN